LLLNPPFPKLDKNMLSDSLPWFASAGLLAGTLAGAHAQPTLKDAFKDSFLVGAALNPEQFSGKAGCENSLIVTQFNTISPENVLKWGRVHPEPDQYNFGPADRYVEFGQKNHMFIVGHALVWHHQTPPWVFRDEERNLVDRDTLLKRMHDHIATVVGRYKGKIGGWDVVNEAVDEDGKLRQSPWLKIIGEDYILKAFHYAHEADPGAELYYNEYSAENWRKRAGTIALIRKLRSQGVSIAAVGLQGHYTMDWPKPRALDKTIKAFAALGVKVSVTELDVDVLPSPTSSQAAEVSLSFARQPKFNPYTNGLPVSVERALAERYAGLFAVFVKDREMMSRVTFWGVTDASSWLNNWPIRGRTSYPLLFDRDCSPKPAFDAVIKTAMARACK
jgi:endo-1,4-beta-xylanase